MTYITLHRLRMAAPRFVLLLSLLLAAIVPVGYAALDVSPAQAAGAAWYDGPIKYSTIINCVSIIQGYPYLENGAGTYVGFLADPESGLPGPNDVYYLHIVIAGLGNSCSGMRAYINLGLPANTSLAIDGTNKVFCFYDNVPLPANECPQSFPASSFNAGMYEIPSVDSAHAYTWPLPQGKFLEIQIPVRSSTALSSSPMSAKVWLLDGNDSPWLQPQQGVYVFNNQPSILYPSPATTSIMSTTAHSEIYLYTNGLGGTGYFDLGTTTGYSLMHEPVTIPAGGSAYMVWIDWTPPPLLPDTLYHWRFTFNSSSGHIYGADQTFRTLPEGVSTVGSGMTGSCTEAALASALAANQDVNFSCGPLPAVITLTSAKTITSDVTIDGGGMVTISSSGSSNHFNVQSGGHLTLNQLKLVNGSSTNTCGGSIRVLANGQLTMSESTFDGNTTNTKGGALCIETGGSAAIQSTLFTNNRASSGGAVFNHGTLVVDRSVFDMNTAAPGHGGAVQSYGTTSISDTTFSQNTAGVNGGAIDAGGTLSVSGSSFTDNSTGVRGGGINVYFGTLSLTDSIFSGNQSGGYGGGIANDEGTVTIMSSEFSGNTAAGVGGGLRSNGTTNVLNSTFSGNQAGTDGGGIENSLTRGQLLLVHTTLSGNSAGAQGGNLYIGANTSDHIELNNTLVAAGIPNNCDNPIFSQGNNLESANTCGLGASGDKVNTNPKLGTLDKNGGTVSTHALLGGSPAIDAGSVSGCPAVDARGVSRPFDGNGDGTALCDIGAYEYTGPAVNLLYLPMLRK